uniref:EF-hand domain-containing protein n=1 Tax=Spongospora subterranea TaxID=70186 RepID=A0A0H5QPC7_9EUKA|eukprot:CRZ03960.1 hypothetical protein [Spongospora subterranea]
MVKKSDSGRSSGPNEVVRTSRKSSLADDDDDEYIQGSDDAMEDDIPCRSRRTKPSGPTVLSTARSKSCSAAKSKPSAKRKISRKKTLQDDRLSVEQLMGAFRLLDRESKGIITRGDIESAVGEIKGDPLEHNDAIAMLNEADKRGDNNGTVNLSDFMIMMESVFPEAFKTQFTS